MKDKLKNYSFWISVTGAVLLLINNLGKIFGFSVNNEAVYSIVDGICGVLVVFGVLTMNKSKKTEATTETDTATNTEANAEINTDISTNTNTEIITDNIDANKTKTEQTQVDKNKTESKPSTQNKNI